MLEQTTPLQDVVKPSEAGFSTNMYLNHPMMGRLQFTFRGATSRDWGIVLEDVDRFLRYMSEKGWKFDGAKPEAPAQPPAPSEPHYQPIDDSGHEKPAVKTFIAERLVLETRDGKHYYKVIGRPFEKYGVRVWQEVLEQANVKVDHATGQHTSINGWTAEYVEQEYNGKKSLKVIKLSPV